MSSPTLYVIAGPNGIGKTTSDFDLVPKNIPVINSDEIAAEIKKTGLIQGNTQEFANREAMRIMDEYLQKKVSFGIETNLADADTWKFLLKIQEMGYQLQVFYISTNDLDVLNSRIQARHQMGGHFVRPDIVRERYLNGLLLLNHYRDKPDKLFLLDNSSAMQLVAEIGKGEVLSVQKDLPEWVSQYLGELFSVGIRRETKARDLGSIDEVRKRYLESTQPENKQEEEQNKTPEKRQAHGRRR